MTCKEVDFCQKCTEYCKLHVNLGFGRCFDWGDTVDQRYAVWVLG